MRPCQKKNKKTQLFKKTNLKHSNDSSCMYKRSIPVFVWPILSQFISKCWLILYRQPNNIKYIVYTYTIAQPYYVLCLNEEAECCWGGVYVCGWVVKQTAHHFQWAPSAET